MKNSLLKKASCVLILFSMILSSTGCSAILEKIAAKEATEYLTEVLDAFYADPVNGLADYVSDYEIPEMLEDSLTFALNGIDASSYEIGEPKINSDRTTAKIPVTFSNVLIVDDIPMGTVDEVSEFLGDCDTDEVKITIVLSSKKGDWKVDDVSELVSLFFEPYESLIFVDEYGMPTSYYEPFFEECLVDTVWYEPLMSTPLSSNTISGVPEALTCCVYFDRPMYLTFEANLIQNDTVIQTLEVNTNGGSIAYCEFWGQTYNRGSYTLELTYDGNVVATSVPVTVN